ATGDGKALVARTPATGLTHITASQVAARRRGWARSSAPTARPSPSACTASAATTVAEPTSARAEPSRNRWAASAGAAPAPPAYPVSRWQAQPPRAATPASRSVAIAADGTAHGQIPAARAADQASGSTCSPAMASRAPAAAPEPDLLLAGTA